MKTLHTALQIHKDKRFYWIKSYKVVVRYIKEYESILKPFTTGSTSGKRYYVPEKNIITFIQMFEDNKLR